MTLVAGQRLAATLAALVAAATVSSGAAAASAVTQAAPTGTWVGRVGGPLATVFPADSRAVFTFTVGAQTLSVVAVGPTGASHDPPSTKAKCTWRYRFEREQAGWRLYRQVAGTIGGAGGLETAPCNTRPEGVARLRVTAGKLKVELGRAGDDFGDYVVVAKRA